MQPRQWQWTSMETGDVCVMGEHTEMGVEGEFS